MSKFKPMLAGKAPANLEDINYPVLCSPKLDGIRCIIKDGVAVSRKLLPIPNQFVQDQLAGVPDGLDGELMIGGGFNAVTSGIMSKEGQSNFTFYVFDWYQPENIEPAFFDICPFHERLSEARWWIENVGHSRVQLVEHTEIVDCNALTIYEAWCIETGYEGAMIRDPFEVYKPGRSTTKQGGLLKLKLFLDEEATVIGFAERMHNGNKPEKDNLGRTKRSTHKANKTPLGTLGALICKFDDGTEFRAGGGQGMTDKLRQDIWDYQSEILGRRVTIRYQPEPGGVRPVGQSPRIPQFHGFRDD